MQNGGGETAFKNWISNAEIVETVMDWSVIRRQI